MPTAQLSIYGEGVCHPLDCLEAMRQMPDKCVDHTVTDPPYEEECHYGQVEARREQRSRHLQSVVSSAISFEPLSEETRVLYALQMVRLTRGWVIAFCQAEAVGQWKLALQYAGAAWRRTCIWVKPNAMPQYSGDRPAAGFEPFVAVWCSPERSSWNGGGKAGVYYAPIPRGADRFHETQKPFSLMASILEDFTNRGELILDPFAGAGTTLLASRKLERRFVGFENKQEYCALTNERLADPLFLPERMRSEQLTFL